MEPKISRRDFLKLALMAGLSAVVNPDRIIFQNESLPKPMPCFINPGGIPAKDSFEWVYNGHNGHFGPHEAIDFFSENNHKPFPVHAVASGKVEYVEFDNPSAGGFLAVRLNSPYDKYRVNYVHMQSSHPDFQKLSIGVHINQGDMLGIADGSPTADTTGVHLHLETWATMDDWSVRRVNPMIFLASDSCNQLNRTKWFFKKL